MSDEVIVWSGHRDRFFDPWQIARVAVRYPGATWLHGGAEGFDRQVQRVAELLGIEERVIVVRPEYDCWPPRIAPLKRNDEMIALATRAVLGWDGRETGGTWHCVREITRLKLPNEILEPVPLDQAPHVLAGDLAARIADPRHVNRAAAQIEFAILGGAHMIGCKR